MQTKEWVLKCGRFVLFKDKVSDPSETITNDKYQQKLSESKTQQEEPNELNDGKGASNNMKSSAGGISMLRKIKWIKLFECFVFNFSHIFLISEIDIK